MLDLISSYLFLHKSCPLPGIGTLHIVDLPAVTDFTNKKISAPLPHISFRTEEIGIEGLLDYVSKNTTTDKGQTESTIMHFCKDLKNDLAQKKHASLPEIGEWNVDDSGQLNFKPAELLPDFLPTVHAERVIHPDAEHSILVGDKETTNTQMTEYYTEEPVKKERWWIWAIIIGTIGVLTILIYINDSDSSSVFGNAGKF